MVGGIYSRKYCPPGVRFYGGGGRFTFTLVTGFSFVSDNNEIHKEYLGTSN